ncbi:hypothetical protein JMJ55_27590 [Belnapia sp. T6]|uniref:Cupin type-1 domain-containing protein n=1 Tax=Belnapia mucosa TaxID=2804532 RepID=A0ABS1VBU7_9PROT|nr:cupin domain-containing protein [Belnapia mucosa]MBL6459095.1 hypothetical protein [Belnapia mucosa]
MTVFASGSNANTVVFGAGDVGNVPRSFGHYIQNTGDTPVRFLEIFASGEYADVSLANWMANTPARLVADHLKLDETLLRPAAGQDPRGAEMTKTVQPFRPPPEEAFETLEVVAEFEGPMPTGVTVSQSGRIFFNFLKWGDDVRFTVAELRDGKPVAYPDEAFNRTDPDDPATALVSV